MCLQRQTPQDVSIICDLAQEVQSLLIDQVKLVVAIFQLAAKEYLRVLLWGTREELTPHVVDKHAGRLDNLAEEASCWRFTAVDCAH